MAFHDFSNSMNFAGFEAEVHAEDFSEVFQKKSKRLQKLRKTLKEMGVFSDLEIVGLLNLNPSEVEEAVLWIPSLTKLVSDGKVNAIRNAISIIQKF